MVTPSARVMLAEGWKVPSRYPETYPADAAACT